MHSIPIVQYAWELQKAGLSVDEIASKVGYHRATIYRWLSGIHLKGIRKFLREYQNAKKGHRHRKTDPVVKSRIYSIRKEFRDCCGEKIQYWYHTRFGESIGVSTIYRILGEKYELRKKYGKNMRRGAVPKADKPRQVIQTDTVDFGQLYAFTAVDICTREVWVVVQDSLDSHAAAGALKQQFLYFNQTELLQRDGGPEFKLEWEQEAKQFCTRIRTARPYRKNEQSYIESFNRTLRKECLGWTKYKKSDIYRVRQKVLQFLDFYNNRRPHLSLNLATPKSVCRI